MKLFRIVSLAEGISWLLLLFIAMPLKYGFDAPGMVRVMGRIHGGLFVLFVLTLAVAATEQEWPLKRSLRAFAWSFVPFGAFVLERELRAVEPRA